MCINKDCFLVYNFPQTHLCEEKVTCMSPLAVGKVMRKLMCMVSVVGGMNFYGEMTLVKYCFMYAFATGYCIPP